MKSVLPLAVLIAFLGACSSPTGPKPAALVPLERAQEQVRLAWSASAGNAERFVFSPAFAASSSPSRKGKKASPARASGEEAGPATAGSFALMPASLTESTRDICPAPMPTV